ncbi:YCF48-related protein [Algoriphagus sp. A40]|uniref:YCF48-related protein n=1 Tax=Algoriphagus sp. A40 TaxID=1945863 RepID=UPI00143B70CA|nr:YCF48-related protein [Algoriphagus sp. A40]
MKRLTSVIFFLLLFSAETLSQSWTRMQSWGLDFESIAWINEQEGILVGENLIVRTSDGGTTWEEVLQKIDVRLNDVLLMGGNKGVAVGENGTVYLSSDGGKSWARKESGTQNDLFSLTQNPTGLLIAAGENGEIINSSDFGETWKKVTSGTTLSLNEVVFVNENTGFIAAGEGKILRTFDKGNSWSISGIGSNPSLFGIAFSNEMIGYAVGENGFFAKTVDGGANWSILNSTTTNTLRKVAISPLDVRIVVAVGDLATVVRTANSGTSFVKPSLGANNIRNTKNLAFKPKSAFVSLAGQDGYLVNSGNSGTSWTQKLAGIRNNFTSVDFKNLNTGFIAGERGSLFVTSNGAATLTHRPIPESIHIETIDFWNTAFGYTGSANGKIYRTTNSGTTWVPVFARPDRSIFGFYLFVANVLYLAGSQGYISSSAESGDVWSPPKESNTTQNLKDLMFFDFQYGFAIGENGQISWSNGGTVWETLPKLTDENLNALAKIDTARAFVVGDGGVILKTDDKARTWKKIESGTTKKLNSIDFFGESYGFIAGEEGLALVTSDGGATWIPSSTGTLRDLNAVSAGTDQKAYFAGEDGTIIAFNCVPPVGNLGQITGDAESCLGTTSYSISGLPQSGSEIIWRVDGGEIISGQGTGEIEVKWTLAGRNAVLVSRSNFCGSGETSFVEVSVLGTPSSNLQIEGDGTVCTDNTYTYSLPSVEGTSYTWEVNGGELVKGQGTPEVEIKWSQKGIQQLSATPENRCGGVPAILKTITVNGAPESPLGISGESRVGLGEQVYEIEELEGMNYRWSISGAGGRILSGQGTGSVRVLWEIEGDFELAVEAQNECSFSSKRILPVNVNIITALEPIAEGNLKIFPNPSQGNLTISSENLDSWSSILIFNPVGQLVESQTLTSGQTEIQLVGLPRGLLVIKLQGKNGTLAKKIQVQ